MNPVKLEKQTLILLLLGSVTVLMLVFVASYDPYAERTRLNDFMAMLLSSIGLSQLGSGF